MLSDRYSESDDGQGPGSCFFPGSLTNVWSLTTQQQFLNLPFGVHNLSHVALNCSIEIYLSMCALWWGEKKLQGLTVLLFLPLAPVMCGYISILLCGQMRLQQNVASCCVEINGLLFGHTICIADIVTNWLRLNSTIASHSSLLDDHYNSPLLSCLLCQKRRILIFEVKALCPLFKFFTVLTLFLFFFCPFAPF